ncbi:MAG TPA: Hpt domain-containing protein [Symbiobacteriaceae bacterium]|nr:Hpt domain-containing protein [Symbiobacteriaceae bacterium]
MDQMRALRVEYLAGAVERLPAMEDWLASGNLDELKSAAHKLAGSGGFYGFDAISEAGRALELLIDGKATRAQVAAGFAELVRVVRAAQVE